MLPSFRVAVVAMALITALGSLPASASGEAPSSAHVGAPPLSDHAAAHLSDRVATPSFGRDLTAARRASVWLQPRLRRATRLCRPWLRRGLSGRVPYI